MSQEQEENKKVVEVKKEEVQVKEEANEAEVEEQEEEEDVACEVADVQDLIIASCEPVKKPTNHPATRHVTIEVDYDSDSSSVAISPDSSPETVGTLPDEKPVVRIARPACGTKADGSPLCADCPARTYDRQPLNVQVKTVATTRTVRQVSTQTEDHGVEEVRGLLDSRFARRVSCPFRVSSFEMELMLSFGMGVAVTLLIQRLMRR